MNNLRSPAVAGRFYPADPGLLREKIEAFCPPFSQRESALAIMVPHAGYIYSGRYAGEAFRRVDGFKTALLLCPNHTGRGKRFSVWAEGAWGTPLGEVPIDEELAAEVVRAGGESSGDQDAHEHEHAIEVQLPFLQVLHPGVRIVPVVLGPLTADRCLQLGQAFARLLRDHPSVLLVASTDMCHYLSADEGKRRDDLALREVVDVHPEGLYRAVTQNDISMCGFIPTTCTLAAVSSLGCQHGELLAYGHSGEVTRELDSVVGYAAAWFRTAA